MNILKNITCRITLAMLITLFGCVKLYAQENPPVPVSVVSVIPALSFGTICDQGAPGGSVNVDPVTGARSASDVVTFGSFTRAEFNIEGNAGTLVTLSFTPDITLLREGGGGSIDMHIEANPPVYLVLQGVPTSDKLYIGGTLTLPGAVPAGTYKSSDFVITINQP
jgi:hypothetical protein